ncbi:MAG: glycosyltransferase family 4 protein [Candidatus Eutrophobiaceae bacterium]
MYQLAAHLAKRSHNIHVLADHRRREADAERAFDHAQPFSIERIGGARPWRRRRKAAKIARLMEESGTIAVIADSWKSMESLPRHIEIPTICLAHGTEYLRGIEKSEKIRRVLSRVVTIVANSRYTASKVKEIISAPERIKIISPGCQPPLKIDAQCLAKAKTFFKEEGPNLISVGRLVRRKGYLGVMHAMRRGLLAEFPKLQYHIIGDGKDRGELEACVMELELVGRVVFHGAVTAMEKYARLACADLFVLPGFQEGNDVEGFGVAFVEAASMGLPCVAGKDGGSGEAVLDGQTGVLCDGRDPDAVQGAIAGLLREPARMQRMAEQANDHARRFLWDRVILEYEAVLDDLRQGSVAEKET